MHQILLLRVKHPLDSKFFKIKKTFVSMLWKMCESITVLRTNKRQTNKGQITFFRKIYSELVRDKCLEIFLI